MQHERAVIPIGETGMKTTRILGLAVFVTGMTACSTVSVQRTAYETLQNVGEQQCEKDLSADCTERTDYDEYQEERKDIEVAE